MRQRRFLFVGERRSDLAVKLGVTWEDGRLAAKQLFDALVANGLDPVKHRYANLFESQGRLRVAIYAGKRSWTLVGMGRKVQAELRRLALPHIELVHPASRGTIRKKANYAAHVKQQLL